MMTVNQEQKKRSVSSSVASKPMYKKTPSSSKSNSKHSILDDPEAKKPSLPPLVSESEKNDSSDSEGPLPRKYSHPYLPPGAELPCVCLYDKDGRMLKMKALCPEHGYMVRRGTGFSCSDGEGDDGEFDGMTNEGEWED